MHEEDLTPEERQSLADLTRERRPPEDLEQRVVRALRAEGLLAPPRPLRLPRSPAWIATAAAASIALFVGGFALGQWVASRQAAELLVAMHQRDAAQASALVQRTGSAYVSALGALASVSGSAGPQEVAAGREVALNALRAAADQIVRLSPEDPLAVRILQAVHGGAARDSLDAGGEVASRLVWF